MDKGEYHESLVLDTFYILKKGGHGIKLSTHDPCPKLLLGHSVNTFFVCVSMGMIEYCFVLSL